MGETKGKEDSSRQHRHREDRLEGRGLANASTWVNESLQKGCRGGDHQAGDAGKGLHL